MTRSFFNGLSGMKSFQSGIDITANNLSNTDTTGYKQNEIEFASLFSQTLKTSPISSDIGLGSRLDSTAINLSQGEIVESDSQFHIALGGEGWLRVKKGDEEYFTRNGAFKKDKDGFLTDDNGDYLLAANANNIKTQNGNYEIDPNISTQNLINNPLSPVFLPDNLIFPSIATSKIKFSTNLNPNLSNAVAEEERDFSALYSYEGKELKVKKGDSFVFSIGKSVKYENNTLSSEICITDDKKDGKDLIFDFIINDKKINLTLQDGSTKEEIQNALLEKLKENGINATISKNGIIISDPKKIILHSNNGNLENISAEKFVYNPSISDENEFNTIKSLVGKMNYLAQNEDNNISVYFSEGKISIENLSDKSFNSNLIKTENSNELLIQNLSSLNRTLNPKTTAKSYEFKETKQKFTQTIIDKNGQKDLIEFDFTKQKVINNLTEFQGIVTIKDDTGNILNETLKTFTFQNGQLLNPKTLTLLSPQKIDINFNLTSYSKTNSKNEYFFSQNGVEKGYLRNYQIEEDGKIKALFSNSKDVNIAQIPVFHFQNPQGLESIGGSLFKETDNSNKAFLYKKEGRYIPNAKILSNRLEASNVNFTQAMTELILNQKAFSAAAKTVTTSDEMIQKAINMKR